MKYLSNKLLFKHFQSITEECTACSCGTELSMYPPDGISYCPECECVMEGSEVEGFRDLETDIVFPFSDEIKAFDAWIDLFMTETLDILIKKLEKTPTERDQATTIK